MSARNVRGNRLSAADAAVVAAEQIRVVVSALQDGIIDGD